MPPVTDRARGWSSGRVLALGVLGCLVTIASGAPSGSLSAQAAARGAAGWRQWGGPNRNFIVDSTGLADAWPEAGPRTLWSRPLGTGHSTILADGGRLFTMYRKGNGRGRQGPWQPEETVVALDAASGATIWEHSYPSKLQDFSYGAGPHSTPLIVGDRLFTIGTNKELFALETKTGKMIWSHDLVAEFNAPSLLIRPVVKAGYGCSPIAYRDLVICSVGGPGQSVMAFRQSDGSVAWKSGDFLVSETAPILISLSGREQLVIVGGGSVNGLEPATGRILWSYPHDPGNDLNCQTPSWEGDLLFLSSAYKAGSRAIRLTRDGDRTIPEEVWFTSRVRFMFLSTIRLGNYIYGSNGDLGPSFLAAMDLKTGQATWQHRGIGRVSIVYADQKAIMLDEDGGLTLARLAPEGVTVLSQAKLFETRSWTAPTLVGTTLYARDREKIVALDLGKAGSGPAAQDSGRSELTPSGARDPGVGARSEPAAVDSAGLSGTWRLDATRSQVTAALVGLSKGGAPETLHITQTASGTVVVESEVNESQSRLYVPNAKTTTPVVPSGTITMTSKWDGHSLVAEGTQESSAAAPVAVKETFALMADGRTLTVAIATGGTAPSTLAYVRSTTVEPCQKWPTACKPQD
jgi:outer membrane protein assembly factor BamB